MDALALKGEEGRDKLRKVTVRRKWPLIREYPNGATQYKVIYIILHSRRRTRGTETSHYPEEKKTKVIPQVVASERGIAQTILVEANMGL